MYYVSLDKNRIIYKDSISYFVTICLYIFLNIIVRKKLSPYHSARVLVIQFKYSECLPIYV